ncbi:hypothetical protein LTR15_003684 [Elasticomyces elasticus]|nr:hypothetical protein LTR15_003684 [Elasticomyces elasticus]
MAQDWEFAATSYTKTYHRQQYPAIDPKNPANSVKGKVVVVTGGGKGIGLRISRAFVEAGAKAVAILGRRQNVLDDAKRELEGFGASKILTFSADVSDGDALNKAFAAIKEQVGPINITVANAAYLNTGLLLEVDVDDWWKGYEVNVKGTLLTYRAFFANKSDDKPTFISLNTGASHAMVAPTMSSYGTSKFANLHLVTYLAAENPEVRAVSYHPGVLESEMNSKGTIKFSFDDMSLPAGFAVWLASDKADFVQGRMLWAHWDVEELEAMKEDIVKKNDLVAKLSGFGSPN